MAATIYDIAKKVKTSAVTVSLALRDSSRVSIGKKNQIKKIAEELGYQPNPLARGLIGARTKTIAFVFNYASEKLANDMSFIELFNFITAEASRHDYKLFFHSSNTAKPIKEVITEVGYYGVDGIVLVSKLNNDDDRRALRQTQIPVVVINRDFSSKNTYCLLFDDEDGVRQIMNHLVSLGHRSIAFVGKHENESAMRRFHAYREFLSENKLSYKQEFVIECGFDIDSGENAASQIVKLSTLPSAIVCAGDFIAIGVLSGLRQNGISVADQVSVTGFSNLHISRFTFPSLTTIDFSGAKTAAIAVSRLLEMIGGNCKGTREIIPANLVVRNSTGKV
jgi:DNA-binding LacI/PurR family transcriptional regulator